jgi:hypothetical protein
LNIYLGIGTFNASKSRHVIYISSRNGGLLNVENGKMQEQPASSRDPAITSSPSKRLTTIDTMKGMSIIMIFYCHFALSWRTWDWLAFMRLTWLVLDFFGPVMFITMSVLGNMLAARGKPLKKQDRSSARRSWLRAAFIIAMGVIYDVNFIGTMGIFFMFMSNIYYIIAIFSLLIPYIVRLKPRTRLVLIVAIMVVYYPILDLSLTSIKAAGVDATSFSPAQVLDAPSIFYFLFINQGVTVPFFPWILVPLISSIVFEPFIASHDTATSGSLHATLARIRNFGFTMIAGGVALGFWLFPGYGNEIIRDMNMPGSFFTWPYPDGIPVFLVRYTLQYLVYNLGIVCVFFGILGDWQLVKGKHVPWEKKINNFGEMSLTGFIMSHVPFYMTWIKLSILIFFAIFIPLIIAVVNLFWLWGKKTGAVCSPEWIMKQYITFVMKKLEKRDMIRKKSC